MHWNAASILDAPNATKTKTYTLEEVTQKVAAQPDLLQRLCRRPHFTGCDVARFEE